jgi:hypothetical protein
MEKHLCIRIFRTNKLEQPKFMHRSELNKSEHGIHFVDKICARPNNFAKEKKKNLHRVGSRIGAKPQIDQIESYLDPLHNGSV